MQLMKRGPEDMKTTHRHFFFLFFFLEQTALHAGIVSSLMWYIQYVDGV